MEASLLVYFGSLIVLSLLGAVLALFMWGVK